MLGEKNCLNRLFLLGMIACLSLSANTFSDVSCEVSAVTDHERYIGSPAFSIQIWKNNCADHNSDGQYYGFYEIIPLGDDALYASFSADSLLHYLQWGPICSSVHNIYIDPALTVADDVNDFRIRNECCDCCCEYIDTCPGLCAVPAVSLTIRLHIMPYVTPGIFAATVGHDASNVHVTWPILDPGPFAISEYRVYRYSSEFNLKDVHEGLPTLVATLPVGVQDTYDLSNLPGHFDSYYLVAGITADGKVVSRTNCAQLVDCTNIKPRVSSNRSFCGKLGSIQLSIEASDPDGDPLTFQWSVHSKPDGAMTEIIAPAAQDTMATMDTFGDYEFDVLIRDPYDGIVHSYISYTYLQPDNQDCYCLKITNMSFEPIANWDHINSNDDAIEMQISNGNEYHHFILHQNDGHSIVAKESHEFPSIEHYLTYRSGDINGDGRQDLVFFSTANDEFEWVYKASDDTCNAANSQKEVLTLAYQSPRNWANDHKYAYSIHDIDDDGDNDLIITTTQYSPQWTPRIIIKKNIGDFQFENRYFNISANVVDYNLSLLGFGRFFSANAYDNEEVIVGNIDGYLKSFQWDSTTNTASYLGSLSLPNGIKQIAVADFNNDQFSDLLMVSDNTAYTILSSGLGSYSAAEVLYSSASILRLPYRTDRGDTETMDINGDGLHDAIIYDTSGQIKVFLNNASQPGQFIQESCEEFPLLEETSKLHLLNQENNILPEILQRSSYGASRRITRNNQLLGCKIQPQGLLYGVSPFSFAAIASGYSAYGDAISYEWTILESPEVTVGPNYSDIVYCPGLYTIQLKATDNHGNQWIDRVKIRVKPSWHPSISGSTLICPSQSTTLSASSGYAHYLWSTGETTQSINVFPPASTQYWVDITDEYGCIQRKYHMLEVHQQPGVPESPICSDILTTSMTVTWTNMVDAAGYYVQRCQGSGCTTFTTIAGPLSNGTTTYSDSNLLPYTSYRYRIKAIAYAGCNDQLGMPSTDILTSCTNPGVPNAPGFSNVQLTSLEINWADIANEAGYIVQRCQGAGCTSFANIGTQLPSGTIVYTDTGLSPSTTYRYRIIAVACSVCSDQIGAPSLEVTTGASLAKSWHTAALLQNGEILIAGGEIGIPMGSAELYDTQSGGIIEANHLSGPRQSHTMVVLSNGHVLAAGGWDGTNPISSVEVYNPALSIWSPAAALAVARRNHTATRLTNGLVLVAGGYGTSSVLSSAEIFNPLSETWISTQPLNVPRHQHTATLLSNGKVLIAGGDTTVTEEYNPVTGTWSNSTNSLNEQRRLATATLLPNGKVLIVGGLNSTALKTAELYDPFTRLWGSTGSLSAQRYGHTATLLPNGKVLVAGGYNGSTYLTSMEIYNPSTGIWSSAGNLSVARYGHTATIMPNGNVVFAKGYNGSYLATLEQYNPSVGGWSNAGSIGESKDWATSTLLPNGKTLIAGGYDGSNALSTCQLYDPIANSWSPTGSMITARRAHTATLLQNGEVLVAGGCCTLASAEIYNPTLGTWRATGSFSTARYYHTATLLPNGKVLIVGGYSGLASLASAQLYNPGDGTWVSAGNLTVARNLHTATLLTNGKVLIAGGDTTTAELYNYLTGEWTIAASMGVSGRLSTANLLPNGKVIIVGGWISSPSVRAEIYDPGTNTWANTGSLFTGRYGHSATLLSGGKILVAGGETTSSSTPIASAELYNPLSGTWTSTSSMSNARYKHTSTLLPNGKVLVAGGYPYTDSAELYSVGLGYNVAWRPNLSAVTSLLCSGDELSIWGTNFAGVSESSGGNSSQSSPSNYPLVQILSLANEQSSFLLSDSSHLWSATSMTSAPIIDFPIGSAMVTVYANGIPSDSKLIQIGCSSQNPGECSPGMLSSSALLWEMGSKQSLMWEHETHSTHYHLYRGTKANLPDLMNTSVDSCLRYEGNNTSTGNILMEDPSIDGVEFYWYLVVGATNEMEGVAGFGSDGARHLDSTGSCY